jgi:hypothetical protein
LHVKLFAVEPTAGLKSTRQNRAGRALLHDARVHQCQHENVEQALGDVIPILQIEFEPLIEPIAFLPPRLTAVEIKAAFAKFIKVRRQALDPIPLVDIAAQLTAVDYRDAKRLIAAHVEVDPTLALQLCISLVPRPVSIGREALEAVQKFSESICFQTDGVGIIAVRELPHPGFDQLRLFGRDVVNGISPERVLSDDVANIGRHPLRVRRHRTGLRSTRARRRRHLDEGRGDVRERIRLAVRVGQNR